MYCPRLDHFRRVNSNGTYGLCGHMTNGRKFTSLQEINDWAQELKDTFDKNIWPNECVRCQTSENNKEISIRQHSIEKHKELKAIKDDYLIVGGTLDSYCNSACMSCSAELSTKISKLQGSVFVNDNYNMFKQIPQDRILQLDINGGEPTFSKNYRDILNNLPSNIVSIRINTNGSDIIKNFEEILKKEVKVNVTLSLDGTDNYHDYARWPIKWKDYRSTVERYIRLRDTYKNLSLDFWTTLSVLNINNLDDIINYAKLKDIGHGYSALTKPECLSIYKNNWITKKYKGNLKDIGKGDSNDIELDEFLTRQESIRNIKRIEELK